ncbi:TPA: hypothetical protein I7764_20005 [Vibrio vulnificus]|nr:hypothetical protein [Vibrio vulnificus]
MDIRKKRQTPDGWRRVYWPEEAIALLKQETVTEIILDHDLGDDTHGTSHDVTLWIEEAVTTKITATFSENNINCFLYG